MPLTQPADTETFFEELRRREFARLDASNLAYLDFTGSALYAESQIEAHVRELERGVFGNPHSAHAPSHVSTHVLDAARADVLRQLDADPATYGVVFTANASAALKLVGEAYPFGPNAGFVLATDNHNSVRGIHEYAKRAGGPVHELPLDDELRLLEPEEHLQAIETRGLLAFPAQSNFSGVVHPLDLVGRARALGFDVLLDAAAYVPTHALSLRETPADFVALSFYKLFGFPTGVGALVARLDALGRLVRPWFAGGTVTYVSVFLDRYHLRPGYEAFEDGTPNFLGIAALAPGFSLLNSVGMSRLTAHVQRLTARLLDGLASLTHRDGAPLVRIYGPISTVGRGGTIAFNVLDRAGNPVPFEEVEGRGRDLGVAMRGGCFCNPGASERAFGGDPGRARACLDGLHDHFTLAGLRDCLGPSATVGAMRASVGLPTNARDVDRAIEVVASFGGH
ncbi:MAG: aminotransferase class V-fold PLP-dependent enzyme [Acidobacteriota bacterium]|nr:aminotransferase class V-fold PLP-dependent enzyme [Acidobacteriota bacterium]